MADTVSIVVRVRDQTRAGITSVNDSLNRLTRGAKDMDKSLGSVTGTALSFAPALIPIAASAAPLAAGLGAAGVAVAAFGAALGPQVAAMGEAADAEKKYTDAVEEHGASSKEAVQAEKAYLQSVQKLPPATREAAAALSVLKDEYKDWSASLAGDTMPVLTKGMATLGGLFPKLTPVVKGASQELDRFMTIAAGGIESSAFDQFMKSFADFSTGALQKANNGLIELVRAMNTGEVGGNLREFMDYARAQGPLVGDTLSNLAQALTKLLVSASDVGVGMLQVINVFADLVASIPTGLLTTLLQVAIAFKAIKIAAAGFAAVGVGIQAITTQIIAMRTAAGTGATRVGQLSAAFMALSRTAKLALAATGIGLLVVAVTELMNVGKRAPIDMEKMSTSLARLGDSGKLSGESLKAVGKDFSEFDEALRGLARPDQWDQIQQGFTNFFGQDSTPVKRWKGVIDDVDQGLANLVKSGNAEQAAAAFEVFAARAREKGLSTDELRTRLDAYKVSLEDLAFEEQLAAQAMGLFGEQALAVQGKLDAQKSSADGLAQSINALSNAVLIARGGIRGMEAAIDAADEALKENGRTLDENTEKGRANNQALDDIAATTIKAAESARENGASWEEVNAIYDRGRAALLKAGGQMEDTKGKAKSLADQILRTPDKTARLRGNMEDLQSKLDRAKARLKSVPDSRKAKVRADIYQLEQAIAKARRELDAINGKTSHTYVVTHLQARREGSHGTELGYAHGGIIGAAGGGPRSRMTLVGEQGPELVNLAPGSTVRSNPDTRRMLTTGGGDNRPIVINLSIADRYIGQVLIDPLSKEIRARGGNVQAVLGQKGK
jgi:hypothetical protein